VSVSRSTLGSDVLHIVVSSGAIEDSRELLTWRPRGLRIAFPVLAACTDEAAVARLVEDAVPKIARGAVARFRRPGERPPSAAHASAGAWIPKNSGSSSAGPSITDGSHHVSRMLETGERSGRRLSVLRTSHQARVPRPRRDGTPFQHRVPHRDHYHCRADDGDDVREDHALTATDLGAALEAFILEHEYCGELDAGVEADRVWMMCSGGAMLVPLVAFS